MSPKKNTSQEKLNPYHEASSPFLDKLIFESEDTDIAERQEFDTDGQHLKTPFLYALDSRTDKVQEPLGMQNLDELQIEEEAEYNAPDPDREAPEIIDLKNARRWRKKVDVVIRKRFKLSGPSLYKKVRYLTQVKFAASLPRSALAEILLNLFLLPDQPSVLIRSILRHHHKSHLAEGITDEPIMQKQMDRLRTFIKEQIKAGYFVYSRAFDTETITPRRLIAKNLAGYTTSSSSRSGRRVLLHIPVNVEVLLHEACHFYTHSAFRSEALKMSNRFFRGMRLSEVLLEGLTEHFTQQIMEANVTDFGPLEVKAYQPYVKAIQHLIAPLTVKEVEDACFRGSKNAVERLIKAVKLGTKAYPLLVPGFALEKEGPEDFAGDTGMHEQESEDLPDELNEAEQFSEDWGEGEDEMTSIKDWVSSYDYNEEEEFTDSLMDQWQETMEEEQDWEEDDIEDDYALFEAETAINIRRAIRRNGRWGRKLGWLDQKDAIKAFLKNATGVASISTDEDFAISVAKWQEQKGLGVDGIVGPKTWRRLKQDLKTSGEEKADAHLNRFLLKYEGEPKKERRFTKNDKEFLTDYIDYNIINSIATVDRSRGRILDWEIQYRDGRKKKLDVSKIPITYKPSARLPRLGPVDYYIKRDDGFIYPIFDGKVSFSAVQTPTIVRMRSYLYVKVKALKDLWDLGMLTGFFAGLVSKLGGTIPKIGTVEVLTKDPAALKILKNL
jgi:hypothetical protein